MAYHPSSKSWETRKVVISPSHVPYLKSIGDETGLETLTDVTNYLIADYRRNSGTSSNTNQNNTSQELDDFNLDDL